MCFYTEIYLILFCSWKVDDVSLSGNESDTSKVSYPLSHLKPYTQYAYYVRTYTITSETNSAQSDINYFRTLPDGKKWRNLISTLTYILVIVFRTVAIG